MSDEQTLSPSEIARLQYIRVYERRLLMQSSRFAKLHEKNRRLTAERDAAVRLAEQRGEVSVPKQGYILNDADDMRALIDENHALIQERDALARTLATLAAAGITTGEDGEPRFHGLTGVEIEGIGVINRSKVMGEGEEMVIDTEAWRAEALAYITGATLTTATKNTRTLQERIYHLVSALEETEKHLATEMAVSRAFDAAAAGRGADGEAT